VSPFVKLSPLSARGAGTPGNGRLSKTNPPPSIRRRTREFQAGQTTTKMSNQTLERMNASKQFDAEEAQYEAEMIKHSTPEHEQMHSTMAIILMFALIGSQYVILFWKRGHPKSFNLFSTIGLWIIPPAMGYISRSWRFLTIWFIFSLLNLFMIFRARQKPLQSITPRMVYKFYSNAFQGTYFMGVLGYIGMFVTMFMAFPQSIFEGALTIFMYGTYFGVLSRDIVDRLSESMAQSMGFYTKEGIPTKHLRSGQCAVCGSAPEDFPADQIHRLTCGHSMYILR
jgi:RING finger protein 121